jgi:6-phosphogluconolactonase
VQHDLREYDDDGALARAAADYVAERARQVVEANGLFNFAVSGGRTPWAMFAALAPLDMPWAQTVLYQVDERVAPAGDPDRNLTNLMSSLGAARPTIEPMDVESADLDAASLRYAKLLPARFDLVHLGLGPDGHTASLIPGDPVLEETQRLVAVTGPYQDRRRMTLTYPALSRAHQVLWLVAGADRRAALALLLAGDVSIPAGRVRAAHSLVMADRAAI